MSRSCLVMLDVSSWADAVAGDHPGVADVIWWSSDRYRIQSRRMGNYTPVGDNNNALSMRLLRIYMNSKNPINSSPVFWFRPMQCLCNSDLPLMPQRVEYAYLIRLDGLGVRRRDPRSRVRSDTKSLVAACSSMSGASALSNPVAPWFGAPMYPIEFCW